MTLSGARRCSSLLAVTRAGWWRLLIATLVALLVSVPLASAAAQTAQGPIAAGRHGEPVARTAVVAGVAGGILAELLKGAAYQGGKIIFGNLLQAFGLADPPANSTTDSDLAAVRTQLVNIQTRLAALDTTVGQLRADVAESEYSVLVGQTTPITSDIETAMDHLDAVSKMTAGNSTVTQRANFSRATLKFIDEKLLSKQEELARRVTGEIGADGLVKAFSKAMKARSPYWTNRTSEQVGEVYDYYQSEEARLLLLRVEYWHAYPDTYSASYIEGQIQKVDQEVAKQKDLLKPAPGFDIFADTRTDFDWGYHDLRNPITGVEAIDQVARYNGTNVRWFMPSIAQIRELVDGIPQYTPWLGWLDNQLGGELGLQDVPLDGVWLQSSLCGAPSGQGKCYAVTLYLDERVIGNTMGGVTGNYFYEGLLIYRYRTEPYWW